MKKILLATTILCATAGFAAADVAFSGVSAAAGIGSDVGGDWATYSQFTVGVKASGETDSGLTFSASTSMTAGTSFGRGGDLGDGFDTAESGAFGDATIAIGGDFGTITFSDDNVDFHDDTNTGDIGWAGTFGAISAGVVTDVDTGEYSVSLGYSANGLALAAATDSYDLYSASVGYTVGAITGTVSTSESEVTVVELAYSAEPITASVSVGDDDTYDVALTYSANGLTLGVETDEAEYTKVTGSYDLGGGLSLEAGADSDDSAYLGAKMAF